jgi:hypothetical protein
LFCFHHELKMPFFYPSSVLSRWLPPLGAAMPGWLAPAPRQPLPLQPFILPPVPTATSSMYPTATAFTTAATTETIIWIGQDYSSRPSICRSVRLAMAQHSQKVVIFIIMTYTYVHKYVSNCPSVGRKYFCVGLGGHGLINLIYNKAFVCFCKK